MGRAILSGRAFVAGGDGGSGTPPTLADVIAESTTAHAGSSFTGSNGNGTATASTLTVSIPGSTTTASWSVQPRLTKNTLDNPLRVEVTARLASVSGATIGSFFALAIRKSDGTAIALVQSRGDGDLSAYVGPSELTLADEEVCALDGTDWFRLRLDGGHLEVWQGFGSPTAPTWRCVYHGDPVLGTDIETATYLTLALYQGSGAGGTVTAQWADVSSVALA